MGILIRPVTEDEIRDIETMINKRSLADQNTVCGHIREIYQVTIDRVKEKDVRDFILNQCKEIMVYTKRMDNKLKKYSNGDYEV